MGRSRLRNADMTGRLNIEDLRQLLDDRHCELREEIRHQMLSSG